MTYFLSTAELMMYPLPTTDRTRLLLALDGATNNAALLSLLSLSGEAARDRDRDRDSDRGGEGSERSPRLHRVNLMIACRGQSETLLTQPLPATDRTRLLLALDAATNNAALLSEANAVLAAEARTPTLKTIQKALPRS